jgi:hypothetical protein
MATAAEPDRAALLRREIGSERTALLLLGESLQAAIADLDGYIERRTAEMAAPAIEEAERSAARFDQRAADLRDEFGRMVAHLESQLASARRRLDAAKAPAAYEDLLASIWLYVNWRYVTKQLTTPQKEMFADAVDASHARMNADDPDLGAGPADRWWRDDADGS